MAKVTLDTKVLDKILREVEKGDQSARIGYFEDSGEHPRSGKTAYEIASINNYGAPEAKIPARPFVTDGAYERELVSQLEMVKTIQQLHKGSGTIRQGVKKAAEVQRDSIAAQLQLARFVYDGNTESTQRNKGFDAPLFETGWLQTKIDIKYD